MRVLDDDTVAFLASGCAVIVGFLRPDDMPHAARGWGIDVLAQGAEARAVAGAKATTLVVVRVLLDDRDRWVPTHGDRIAVTGTSVRTLRSLQCKGTVIAVTPATDDERLRASRYVDAFATDIVETDGTPRAIVERMVPDGYRACTIAVTDLYDQTPGPTAGRPFAGTA